jgi:hypothetical protein
MLEKCINSGESIPEPRIPFGEAGIPLGGGILEKVFSACCKMLEKCINSGESIPEPRIPFSKAGIPVGGGILERNFSY